MDLWLDVAERDPFDSAGKFLQGPYRGVLHTTEGSSYAGAREVYRTKRVAPHFTVSVETGKFEVWQHISLDRAGRALENPPGGVQTNRIPCIQVEVVWRASQAHEMTDTLLDGLRALMMWIEDQTGIKPWSPPFVGGEGYGATSKSRMRSESWLTFDGWCGHQHVPENKHWDPGRIPIERLLVRQEGGIDVPEGEIRLNHPPTAIVACPTGGYWVVGWDGGVFAFDGAPALTAIGGDPVEKIISATATPDGLGLYCLGEDGGVFALGSARYAGRVYWP